MFDLFFSYVYRFLRRYLGIKRNLPKATQTLVWMIALYDFNFALSSTFINIFLFRARDDWDSVGFYNLAMYLAIMPAFWIGGHLSKKWGDWLPYQLGFGFNASVFLAVLLMQENAPDHPVFLGLLSGLGIGFYYLGQHSLTVDLTSPKNRDYFLSLSLFMSSILRILAPFLAGWIIRSYNASGSVDHSTGSSLGYYLVFAMTLVIYLALIVRSLGMSLRPKGGKFELWKVLWYKQNRDWNGQMTSQFILGLRNGVFWFVIGILVYRISRNEGIVGSYNMMANFLAVLTAYGLSLWAARRNRFLGLWISALLTWSSCLLLAWRIDYSTLLVYMVLNAVGVTWFQVAFGAISFEALRGAKNSVQKKLEYLAARELTLGAGRILSLSAFLIGYHYYGELALRISLPVFGFMHMGVFLFLPKDKKGISPRRSPRTPRKAQSES